MKTIAFTKILRNPRSIAVVFPLRVDTNMLDAVATLRSYYKDSFFVAIIPVTHKVIDKQLFDHIITYPERLFPFTSSYMRLRSALRKLEVDLLVDFTPSTKSPIAGLVRAKVRAGFHGKGRNLIIRLIPEGNSIWTRLVDVLCGVAK